MNRLSALFLPVLLAVAAAPLARSAGIPEALSYKASAPAYASLEKQASAFVAKLRAAPDDAGRGEAADSFLAYLARVEDRLSAGGKADFATEVRAYRELVLLYREELRAAAEDPFAADGIFPRRSIRLRIQLGEPYAPANPSLRGGWHLRSLPSCLFHFRSGCFPS